MSFRPQIPRVAFSAAVASKEDEWRKAGLFECGIALDGVFEALEDYPGLGKVTLATVDPTHNRSIVLGQLALVLLLAGCSKPTAAPAASSC